MKRPPSFPLFVFALAACASLQPIAPKPTVITSYGIGDIETAGIGDAIIDVQAARKVPEFVALRSYDPGRIRFGPRTQIDQGARYRAISMLKSGDYVIKGRSDSAALQLVVTPAGVVQGYYNARGGASGGNWPTEPLFRPAETLEGQEGAFRAQLIYSGLDGSTVRATYREFGGDFIRPAFSQELQYNLSQDSTIAYKTIKIQVLQASNSLLRYRVTDDGGLPWLPGNTGNIERRPHGP